jgi:hypothetical protein
LRKPTEKKKENQQLKKQITKNFKNYKKQNKTKSQIRETTKIGKRKKKLD